MARRSRGYRVPREWLAEGEWPGGSFVEDAPTAVAYAVEISKRLESQLEGLSKAELARRAGIERTTLYDVLSGRTWPDAVTLAKLEEALQTKLWPDHPVPPLS
ncbi:MAG TPA: helix-turn-helix transcriptional regulator [Cellulomonas sp.]